MVQFACDITALDGSARERHTLLSERLLSRVVELRELPNGYGVHLPGEHETILHAAEFIALERLCCPFFSLALRLEPDGGPLWVEVTGPEGIKPFIRAEFGFA